MKPIPICRVLAALLLLPLFACGPDGVVPRRTVIAGRVVNLAGGGAGPKRLRAPRGAKAEREAAAKPPRPQWGLGLLARLRYRPIAPQERICRRLVSDGATGGRGPPAGDSQGARPEHGRVHQEIHAKKRTEDLHLGFFVLSLLLPHNRIAINERRGIMIAPL